MGVHVDETLSSRTQGPYTFRAQGAIYHKIGNLLPNENERPRYMQLYIYDTDHETKNRLQENGALHGELIDKIKHILNIHNPFVHIFCHVAERVDIIDCRLQIKEQSSARRQYDLPMASEVAAIFVGAEEAGNLMGRDIIVQSHGSHLHNVQDIADDESVLLRGGRLLHQYTVDNCVQIESNKVRWVRNHQNNIRADFYQGLLDALHAGENCGENIGRRTILPSSFVGSPRDMCQHYQDAMALVHKYGRPDLFLTVTCNPNWPEIKKNILPGQSSNDRPDLNSRVFRSRFEELKKDILTKNVLGKVMAYVYVIEFHKRGLPHAHMLIILDDEDKLATPEDFNTIVRAEIPDSSLEP